MLELTMPFVAALAALLLILGMPAWLAYRDFRNDQKRREAKPAESVPSWPAYQHSGSRSSANESFLAHVRERSGYGTLRALHNALVYVAIAAIVGGSLYLCSIAPTVLAGAIVIGVAALFVVALLIERWVFVLIVDAVDVYVDRTRREAEGK